MLARRFALRSKVSPSNRVVTSALPKLLVLFAALAALHTRSAQARPPTVLHLVRQGQTIGSIAKLYRITVARLCAENGQACRRTLKPGDELRITPGESAQPTPNAYAARFLREPYAARPLRPGNVTLHSPYGFWSGPVVGKDGKLTKTAAAGFERMLACRRTGKSMAIEERLIRTMSKVSDHFGGRAIRVVSGFRPWSPDQYTTESKHNVGRALDFSIPGVPNEVVRDFCRSLPDVGCGYYPNSSFVHLDVREGSAYWIDYSGPGEQPRYAHGGAPEPSNGGARNRAEAAPESTEDPAQRPEADPAPKRAPSAPARATRPSQSSPAASSASRSP
jgi:hypothetical protein